LMQEALEVARGIPNERFKGKALTNISCELSKQGKLEQASLVIQEAHEIARGISDEWDKCNALEDISRGLAKQGKIEEALEVVRAISNEYDRSNAIEDISGELAKQGHWSLAEKTGIEISRIADRHECWKKMAKSIKEKDGWGNALINYNQFQNEETRLFYLKGWTESMADNDVSKTCLQQSLTLLARDSDSLEKLLQAYCLNEVFFGKPFKELITRINRTFNIQWALDIVAQFPKDENIQRLSTNLDEWLHEISDEDDREEIQLLAKKVAKGKMTEEEFGERVRGMG